MNKKVLPYSRNLRILKTKTRYMLLATMLILNFVNVYILTQALLMNKLLNYLPWFILGVILYNIVYFFEGGIFLFEAVCYDRNRNAIYILHQGCYPKKKLNVRLYGVNWHLAQTYERDQYHIKRTKKKTYISLGSTSFKTEITISKTRDKLIFGDEVENDQK